MRIYRVEVSVEGRWWMIYVPELGLHTQAADIADVRLMAIDLIAGMTHERPWLIEVEIVSSNT